MSLALVLLPVAAAWAQGTSTASSPTVTFSTFGNKVVTLKVCNAAGCNTVTRTVTVLNPMPQVAGTTIPLLVGTGQVVTLQDTATGRPPLAHSWTVTDATNPDNTSVMMGNPATWTVPSATGVYNVQVQVANGDGSFTTVPVPVTAIGPTFADVPTTYWAWKFIQNMYTRGVFDPCGAAPFDFCPEGTITRAQMAILLLRAKEGAAYIPPPCVTAKFTDMPCTDPAAPWVNELVVRGVTAGCGGGNYCPLNPVTRDQMSVFLLVAKEGGSYHPDPTCVAAPFNDVPCSNPFAIWVRELVTRGVTAGCGGGAYCPGNVVNRAQMSIFISTAFNLPPP